MGSVVKSLFVRSLIAIALFAGSSSPALAVDFCADTLAGRKVGAPLHSGLVTRPRALLVSGASGTGKSTLINLLMTEYPDLFQLGLSTTVTTRSPRPGEVSGRDYTFVSLAEFKEREARGEFIESQDFAGNSYGTSRVEVDRLLALGKTVILDKDADGAAKIRGDLKDRQTSIFISPPNMVELERRLRGRGTETEEKIQQRLASAKAQIDRAGEYDFVVVNDDLDQAYRDLKKTIEAIK